MSACGPRSQVRTPLGWSIEFALDSIGPFMAVRSGMAHKRKDTLVPSPEWWKHLRPFNKRRVAKKERKAAERMIRKEKEEVDERS